MSLYCKSKTSGILFKANHCTESVAATVQDTVVQEESRTLENPGCLLCVPHASLPHTSFILPTTVFCHHGYMIHVFYSIPNKDMACLLQVGAKVMASYLPLSPVMLCYCIRGLYGMTYVRTYVLYQYIVGTNVHTSNEKKKDNNNDGKDSIDSFITSAMIR